MRIKNHFILFSFCINIGFLSGMSEMQIQYGENDSTLRKYFFCGDDIATRLKEKKMVHEVKYIPEYVRYGTCHNYVFSVLMGIEGEVPKKFKYMVSGQEDYYDPTMINILSHFEQVVNPLEGDIVLYKGKQGSIEHTGLVTDAGYVRSKWGIWNFIFDHPVWHVPDVYGDEIEFWRPKKVGKDLMKAIRVTLKIPSVCKKLITMQKQNMQSLVDNLHYEYDDQKSIINMLYARMNIDVNKLISNSFTPLMVATCYIKPNQTRALLKFGADVHKKNSVGDTALIVLFKYNNFETLCYSKKCNVSHIMSELLQLGADIHAKDNKDNTMLDYSPPSYKTIAKTIANKKNGRCLFARLT